MPQNPIRLAAFAWSLLIGPLAPGQDLFPATTEYWEGTASPTAVATADFDGDGVLDVAAVTSGTGLLHVWRGLDVGEFDRPVRLPVVGQRIRGLRAADMDADGLVDLVVIGREAGAGNSTLLKNAGGLEFEVVPIATVPTDYDWWEVADVDGNGTLDFVGSSLGVLDATAAGAGIFVSRFNGATFEPTPLVVTSERATRFRLADLTGDGVSDLFYRTLPGATWQLAESLGPLGFAAPTFPLPPALSSLGFLDLADLDGDGDLDVYGFETPSQQQEIQVAESFGGLSVGAPQTIPLSFDPLPSPFRPRDLTGDGRDEIFLASGSVPDVYALEALGGLALGPPRRLVFGATPLGFGDLTGNGGLELVARQGIDLVYHIEHTGGGSQWFSTPQGITSPTGFVNRVEFDDVDGDGDPDLLVLSGLKGIQWLRNDGAMKFARATLLQGPSSAIRYLSLEDLNGDGAKDLLVINGPNDAIGVQISLGGGAFAAPVTVSSVGTAVLNELKPTNFDSDGDTDLIQSQRSGNSVELFTLRNSGTGTSFPRQRILRLTDGVERVVILDLDGDGFDDLVTFQLSTASVMLGLGDGSFAPATLALSSATALFWGKGLDLDQDGDLDVVGFTVQSDLVWAENTGVGTLGPFQLAPLPAVSSGASVELSDVNQDGVMDLMVRAVEVDGNNDVLFLGQAGGGFGAAQRFGSAISWSGSTEFVDLDSDGDLDALSFGTSSIGVHENILVGQAGQSVQFCERGAVNSEGLRGEMAAYGDPSVTSDNLQLRAIRLPRDQFGIFVGSLQSQSPVPVPGSSGTLCLDGSIGRYDEPAQILSSGPGGAFAIALDPLALETGPGPVPAVAGESWYFQAWHRDVGAGNTTTSNFTGAVRITFTP